MSTLSTLGSDTTSYTQPPPVPPSSIDSNPGFVSPPVTTEETVYPREIVRSTLPLPLAVALPEAAPNPVIETPIVWNGQGNTVFLARADGEDDDANALIPMERDGERFIANISPTRGTHHLRFLVDDQTLVSDDMPKAVDEQGALANYVSVGLSITPPPPLPRGHSFWSTSSAGANVSALPSPQWTTEIPLELTEAAAEEDAFIASYNANSVSTNGGRRKVVNGFKVAPNPTLPPAPMLPRHLEKQILSMNSGNSSSSSSKEKRRGRHGHGHVHRSDSLSTPAVEELRVLPVTTASGTDVTTASFTPITPITNLSASSPPLPHDTIIADDNSILPVPSHVVLNHLSTSSIRNGVLAVSDTVRYKNKYITTIYYKPT